MSKKQIAKLLMDYPAAFWVIIGIIPILLEVRINDYRRLNQEEPSMAPKSVDIRFFPEIHFD